MTHSHSTPQRDVQHDELDCVVLDDDSRTVIDYKTLPRRGTRSNVGDDA